VHLYQARYPNGFVCPKCGDMRESWNTARCVRKCKGCKAHISLLVGTVMEKTHLPLLKWFHAMRHKRGCSSVKLEQELHVTADQLIKKTSRAKRAEFSEL